MRVENLDKRLNELELNAYSTGKNIEVVDIDGKPLNGKVQDNIDYNCPQIVVEFINSKPTNEED